MKHLWMVVALSAHVLALCVFASQKDPGAAAVSEADAQCMGAMAPAVRGGLAKALDRQPAANRRHAAACGTLARTRQR